ncbi:MAG: radical SAM family heme chaperone HemW [Planctomycetales bacterium]|nr:radical SAM family heme chaperone HemW [Planctomycetales bacterium]
MPTPPTTSPRSAYVHVPFCRHRCAYCNFTVVAGRDELAQQYLAAVAREWSRLEQPQTVDTLYFGGGTPTQLTLPQLEQLLELAARWHPLAAGGEWTVEANPEDVTGPLVDLLLAAGVTRVSLGSQSLSAAKLVALDRQHAPGAVASASRLIRTAGLQLATDLIFAAPGETLADWCDDLAATLALSPDHVSTYGLTFERGTQFWSRLTRGQMSEADEELQREMFAAAIETLAAAGFEHYEVSNFARPGRRSRHNEAYWAGAEYFAVGPGAARYVAGVRETNHRSTTTYLRRVLAGQSPVAQREQLAPDESARERLIFGLRRLEGVERSWFRARTGFEMDELAGPAIARFVELGLLVDDGAAVRLTRDGLFVSDAIWPDLL